MKVGDKVKLHNNPEYGSGKIIRFYASQGTVLIDFAAKVGLTYCDYSMLVKQ